MSDKTVELSQEMLMALLTDIFQERETITDFDSVPQSGIHSYNKATLNRPAGLGEYGFVMMFRRTSLYGLQLAFSDRAGKWGYRCHWDDGWHAWRIL